MTNSKILVVDDELDIRRLLQEILTEEGYDVQVAADAAEARVARGRYVPDLVLLDIWMPDTDGITLLREWADDPGESCPVVMMSGHGTVETAIEATRLGAFDYVEKPLSLAKLLRTVDRALRERVRKPHLVRRVSGAAADAVTAQLPGRSRAMVQLRTELSRLAASASPLLLLGEPGTELETVARFVHQNGPHAAGPLVVVDSRLLAGPDAGSALLGSVARPGLLAQASGGSLLLADVEDMSPGVQPLLAAVLERGMYTPEGVAEPLPLDARVLSTARPELVQRAANDVFRRDLFGRLSEFVVRVPAIREYAEDIPELLRHHVDALTEREGLRFRRYSVAAQNRLRNYPWPDNTREMQTLTRRFLVAPGGDEITLEDVERELAVQTPQNEPLVKQDLLSLPLREAREQFERAYLQQQLLLCNGKVGLLAKRVDMERTHLYRKLRSLGVEIGQVLDD